MDLKHETPSKSKSNVVNKVLPNSMNCDSPFRFLPNISTPPSRFTKILNPFEHQLIDRLHLPTFSPSVFAQVSTPKTEEKFKWTIDDISCLKPADIDEETLSQHVSNHDPTMESMAQEKINKFFKEKAIVPSPLNEQVKQMPLIISPLSVPEPPRCTESCAQTVLTLPPVLPKHVEEVLAPYFSYTLDQQNEIDQNSSLYRKLFEFDEHSIPGSSPAPSTGLSPIQFSPEFNGKSKLESTLEIPELGNCTLSPIGRSPLSRSVCRLNFSGHMSVDASLVVPDVNRSLTCTTFETSTSFQPIEIAPNDSVVNWDMEYKHVSILSQSPESNPDLMNSSDSLTPRSKMFTSQRKRLSDSFKDEHEDRDIEMTEEIVPKRLKNRLESEDLTDTGYHTGNLCDSSLHVFASTPTKIKH